MNKPPMLSSATTAPGRAVSRAAPPRLSLRVVHGPSDLGRERSIALDEGELVLGRQVQGDGHLADERISRRHARIVWEERSQARLLEDLGSRNGTFLDGRRLDPARPVSLVANQVICLGGDTLLVAEQELDGDDLPAQLGAPAPAVPEILGDSLFARRLRASLATVASTGRPVLLLGETGTGKGASAEAIHRLSARRMGRFVACNCGAIPPGLAESALFGHVKGAFTDAVGNYQGFFTQADGGTLFLDEVGELRPEIQVKLLRVLEDGVVTPVGSTSGRQVAVRVVAATNARVDDQAGLRRDLLARLGAWRLALAPLSARRADVLPLFEHFWSLARGGEAADYTSEFAEALLLAGWPENVRGVEHLALRLATVTPSNSTLDLDLLPSAMQYPLRLRAAPGGRPASSSDENVDLVADHNRASWPVREELEALLRAHCGNLAAAARAKGCHRTQLARWLGYRGIDPASFRGAPYR